MQRNSTAYSPAAVPCCLSALLLCVNFVYLAGIDKMLCQFTLLCFYYELVFATCQAKSNIVIKISAALKPKHTNRLNPAASQRLVIIVFQAFVGTHPYMSAQTTQSIINASRYDMCHSINGNGWCCIPTGIQWDVLRPKMINCWDCELIGFIFRLKIFDCRLFSRYVLLSSWWVSILQNEQANWLVHSKMNPRKFGQRWPSI